MWNRASCSMATRPWCLDRRRELGRHQGSFWLSPAQGRSWRPAKRLGINHATAARRITSLETALGAQLVVRRTNGCGLTGEGEAFLTHAERMEAEMLAAQAKSRPHRHSAISGHGGGIGAPGRVRRCRSWPPRLGSLIARHPDLRLQLGAACRAAPHAGRSARAEYRDHRRAARRGPAGWRAKAFVGLFACRSTPRAPYLAEHGTPTRTDQLKQHRLISYVEDLIFSPSLHFTREILRNWTAQFEISSATGQTEAVRSGAGIAVLHDYHCGARVHEICGGLLIWNTSIQTRSYTWSNHEIRCGIWARVPPPSPINISHA